MFFCVIIVPIINDKYFSKLTVEQQCLAVTRKAKKNVEFKNLSKGNSGKLFYVVNTRKVYIYEWEIYDKGIIILNENKYNCWSYPQREMRQDEIEQAINDLNAWSNKNKFKVSFKEEIE